MERKMWASMTVIRPRQTNPRTERQPSQQRQVSELARNWTRELIISWWKRMARKCEQACHSYKQGKPIHVQSTSWFNNVRSPSSIGIEPVSWLKPDQIEWKGNVSKRVIHMNKTNQSTYRDPVYSRTSALRVRSELNPWVDYHLRK
jgi:hypothetical protein